MKHSINAIASLLSLFIIACNQPDTAQHQPAADEIKQQADANSASAGQADPDTAAPGAVTIKDERLNAVYQQYVHLTEALVKGDMTNARIAGNAIQAGMNETAQTGAKETKESALLKASAEKIAKASDIESQRKAYAGMSAELIALVKKAGVANGELYVSYCPMVFDDEGASWLSMDKKILNPYFGDKMLTCGEIKETITIQPKTAD